MVKFLKHFHYLLFTCGLNLILMQKLFLEVKDLQIEISEHASCCWSATSGFRKSMLAFKKDIPSQISVGGPAPQLYPALHCALTRTIKRIEKWGQGPTTTKKHSILQHQQPLHYIDNHHQTAFQI